MISDDDRRLLGERRIQQEIKHAHNKLSSDLTARDQHPTYGYTKTQLRRDLWRLTHLLEADLLLSGKWIHLAQPGLKSIQDHALLGGIDLKRLEERI